MYILISTGKDSLTIGSVTFSVSLSLVPLLAL